MAGFLRTCQFIFYGTKHFGKDGYIRASKTFDSSIMARRLDGKVCLVTGANQGLGLHVSEELASRGAHVLMVCRSPDRGQEAVDAVRAKTGNPNVELKVCDVSSLESIAALAKDLDAAGKPLHVLINNAGVLIHERLKSADGYDINFATNTLGCYVLTRLLEGRLRAGAPSKVIFVSSGGALKERLDTEDLLNERMKTYDGITAYAKDKRRQIALAERFSELWKGTGVSVYSMHPGWTVTDGVKKSIPGFYKFYQDKFRELPMGSDTIVYLSLEDDTKLEQGGFYLDRAPQPKHLSWGGTTYTNEEVDKLWQRLDQLGAKALSPKPHA